MDITINPIKNINGEISVPGDKSISHRSIMLGALCNEETIIENFLTGEDCLCTIDIFKKMGVEIKVTETNVKIKGRGLRNLLESKERLNAGNSGTTIRIVSGILAGQKFNSVITGDESLVKRPMNRIIEPLKQMGADIISLNNDGCAPLKIKVNDLNSITYKSPVASAQVKSCILLAGLFAKGKTTVIEPNVSRDHTERMLKFFDVFIDKKGLTSSVEGITDILAKKRKIYVPSDVSSGAFFIAAATLLEGSVVVLKKVGINPTRRGIVDVLIKMGADIKLQNITDDFEPMADIVVTSSKLKGINIEHHIVPNIIDEIPILCVCAAKAEGLTIINGVGELKVKETDRVASMIKNLTKAGVRIFEENDILYIEGKKGCFEASTFESYKDHRTAMSMIVASLMANGQCTVKNIECINTSFPGFMDLLKKIIS